MKKHVFSFTICSCFLLPISQAQSWSITGNGGTNPGINFFGTTDNKDIVFKTNNAERLHLLASGNFGIGITAPLQKLDVNGNINIGKGFSLFIENRRVLKIDSVNQNTFLGNRTAPNITTGFLNTASGYQALFANATGSYNTAYGANALASNNTGNTNVASGAYTLYSNNIGSSNTANGYAALYRNTSGSYNVANGAAALYSNTTGVDNIAVGASSLQTNTTGNRNIANGKFALFSNISGEDNIAVGANSLYYNKDASQNVACGKEALYNNISGFNNIAIGATALYLNTSGGRNIAIGQRTLFSNISGYNNIASGFDALYSNKEGSNNIAYGYDALYSNISGSENIAIGSSSLYFNTTGSNNVASGNYALYDNSTGSLNVGIGVNALGVNNAGSQNTAVGYHALWYNGDSWNNTAIGYKAGYPKYNGWNNTFIGAEASATYDNTYNSIAIGNAAYVTASNQVRIGNNVTSSIGGYTNWTNISDGRVKKNIKENVPGLAFINKLKPITYNLNLEAADNIIQPPARMNKEGKVAAPTQFDLATRMAKEQVVYTGFVAQDVEKAAKELNYNFSGVDAAKDDKDLYGLRYAEFVVPLVKAVQELSTQNDELKQNNASLQQEIDKLKAMVQSIAKSTGINDVNSIILSGASLEQNSPNPFNQSTIIRYTLPAKFTLAQILITDQSGKLLKQITISPAGKGMINVQAGSLTAGIYNYSLVTDGHLIDTKRMILTK